MQLDSRVGFAPQLFVRRLRIGCVRYRIRPSFFSNSFFFQPRLATTDLPGDTPTQ